MGFGVGLGLGEGVRVGVGVGVGDGVGVCVTVGVGVADGSSDVWNGCGEKIVSTTANGVTMRPMYITICVMISIMYRISIPRS